MAGRDRSTEVGGFSFRVKEREGLLLVQLAGPLDERADLSALRPRLSGRVLLDLAEVSWIDPEGVRHWLDLVRDLPRVERLAYRRCSVPVVEQLNVISDFRGPGEVHSFLAPYACGACGRQEQRVLDRRLHFATRASPPVPPEFACACGGKLTLDDLPERYLAFLDEA